LPVFIFLIPGIIAYAMTKTGQLKLESYDQALPMMIATLLPTGVKGLVAAGLLAALMSSLASVFNSCSTLFTVDIYKKLRPDTPEKKLVRVGQLATGIVVVLGILWIPVMANISGVLYEYIQSVQSYIAPPITAVFLLGISWKRINARGALATLVGGFILGMSRLIIEAFFMDKVTGILHAWASINFLHFCVYLFLICVVICITFSLTSPAQSVEKIQGLARGTLSEEQKVDHNNRYGTVEVVTSLFIVGIIIWILTYFTG
jgi:SSS family solute:Na+ symporter